jgi:hypothetical protein
MTSLPGRSDGSSLHYTAWTKKNPTIYIKNNIVVHSVSWEFKTGDVLTPEQVQDAKARGYIVRDISESTTVADIATVAPSAAPTKRTLKDVPLSILLNETINMVCFSTDEEMSKWSDSRVFEVERVLKVAEFFCDYEKPMPEPLFEALFCPRTDGITKAKKRAYRRHNKAKLALARKRVSATAKVRRKNYQKKGLTPGGKVKKKHYSASGQHINEGNFHKGYSYGCSFADFFYYDHKTERPDDQYRMGFVVDGVEYTGLKIGQTVFENQELLKRLELDLVNSVMTQKPCWYDIGNGKMIEVRDLIRAIK